MNKYISTHIVKLGSWSSLSNTLGELATKTSSRLEAVNALSQKTILDSQISNELTKLGSAVLDAIKASKDSDLLKGLLIGTGAALPLAAAGGYIVDKTGDKVQDMGNKAMAAMPVAVLAGLAAGKAIHGRSKESSYKDASSYSTKDMLAAISLNIKLSNAQDNTKVAEAREYTEKVRFRSNAHVADIVNQLLN
jgi:hypothetical protein